MNQEQFMRQVYPEPNTGCWLWSGRINNKGYGIGKWPNNIQLAHRYSFLIHKSDPKGLCVLHHCDNPLCVSPDHLYLGDMAQNCLDRDTRGRQKTKRGCEHKLSRFTPETIKAIRSIHDPNKYPSRKLAAMYLCSQKAIMNIINHKSYKDVL